MCGTELKMNTKLRWLTRKRRITAEQVNAYQEKWDLSKSQALRELAQDGQTTVLQYQTQDALDNTVWLDVEQTTEYYD